MKIDLHQIDSLPLQHLIDSTINADNSDDFWLLSGICMGRAMRDKTPGSRLIAEMIYDASMSGSREDATTALSNLRQLIEDSANG